MEKETREKLENFWYYYKWYVVGGVFVLLALIVGIHSCSVKPNPDLYVLFTADHSPNPLLVEETEEWLGTLTQDVNGDEKTSARVMATSTIDQWNGYNTAAMLVQVNSGKAVLYIMTDATYKILHENGMLQTLEGESANLQGDRYDLTASGVLKASPGFAEEEQSYYLGIRRVEGTTFEGKEHYLQQEKLAKALLQIGRASCRERV